MRLLLMKLRKDNKSNSTLGLCPFLFYSIYPYLLILSRGGKFNWVRESEEVIVTCPMVKGVVTGIKRNKRQLIVYIRKNKGSCDFKYKTGDIFEFEIREINHNLMDIYNNFPYLFNKYCIGWE